MSTHAASVRWIRETPDFTYDTFSRDHEVRFESGTTIPASSAVDFKGTPTRVNPEEGLVGALSSCHMLTFLAICARKRLVVDSYSDDAVGVLEKNTEGKLAVTRITLRPKVTFDREIPADELAKLHEMAHANCFIAQSIKATVTVEG